jgi:hypothetical protein
MLNKASVQIATRKSIVDHCSSFIIAMIVLWVLARYKDAYPLNYVLLFIWIFALLASVPPACVVMLAHQGSPDALSDQDTEVLAEDIIPIPINRLSRRKMMEYLNYCWPNCSSIRDELMTHKTVMSKAAILALSLSISLVILEVQFNISTSALSNYLAIFRSAISCWWTYSLLSGLRFGGYDITECQHR